MWLLADASGTLLPCIRDETLALSDFMPPFSNSSVNGTSGVISTSSSVNGTSSRVSGPTRSGTANGTSGGLDPPRYFIQGNLKSNRDVTPHIAVQLLHAVLELPEGTAYVSLYESGRCGSVCVCVCVCVCV